MAITEFSKRYLEKMIPGYSSKLSETDPEFIERFTNFAFDEVVNQDALDGRTRFMAILAALLGCQGLDMFKVMVPAALRFGVTPVEIKEIVYQLAWTSRMKVSSIYVSSCRSSVSSWKRVPPVGTSMAKE